MANNERFIWDYLKQQGMTDAGAAGVMGNLFAESGLIPTNLQNSYNQKLGYSDENYTKAVDNGTYTNFVKDSAGYGLAQWTYWSRKQELLNFVKQRGVSIGDLKTQLDFLMIELNRGYQNLLQCLKTTSSIKEASNGMLLQFERPANQGNSVQMKRASYAQDFYNRLATSNIPTGGTKMKYNANNKPLVCMQTNSTCYKQTRKMNILGILWHSTGANNPTLRRYIQPLKSDPNYSNLIKIIGVNNNGNDYNHSSHQSGLNAWIGKCADGSVRAVQSMPWNFRPWGCGSGAKGSCNNGWIQFEICEDNLNDPVYFEQVYKEACELTAYLCKLYNINPNGTVRMNGVNIPTILCHADSHRYGFGSNHGDVLHWFPRFGKSMETVRADITKLLKGEQELPVKPQPKPTVPEEEDEDMTQEKFNEMMNNWLNEQADKDPGNWSAEARQWGEKSGLINGDQNGRKMYKKPLTREEFIAVLYRAIHRPIL